MELWEIEGRLSSIIDHLAAALVQLSALRDAAVRLNPSDDQDD